MDVWHQFTTFLTPLAIATAVISGIALGWTVHRLRPRIDRRLTTYIALIMALLWYLPSVAQSVIDSGDSPSYPWGALSKLLLFVFGYLLPASWTLRLLQRRDRWD